MLNSLLGRKGVIDKLTDYWDVATFFEVSGENLDYRFFPKKSIFNNIQVRTYDHCLIIPRACRMLLKLYFCLWTLDVCPCNCFLCIFNVQCSPKTTRKRARQRRRWRCWSRPVGEELFYNFIFRLCQNSRYVSHNVWTISGGVSFNSTCFPRWKKTIHGILTFLSFPIMIFISKRSI